MLNCHADGLNHKSTAELVSCLIQLEDDHHILLWIGQCACLFSEGIHSSGRINEAYCLNPSNHFPPGMKKHDKKWKRSLQNRSILLLWRLLTAIKLPIFGPLAGLDNINQATSTFSTPYPPWPFEVQPNLSTARINRLNTVWALLLVLALRNMILREYPSTQPGIAYPQLMILWFPFLCHRKSGAVTK